MSRCYELASNPTKIAADYRRFTGIECNAQYANNKVYFTNLYKQTNSDKYNGSFYNYFIKIHLIILIL